MRLQNFLLPQAGICTERDLYIRSDRKVHLSPCTGTLSFEKYGEAQFDTYFNGFSVEKWRKYTEIGAISVTLFLKGRFEIELLNAEKVFHGVSEQTLSVSQFESETISPVTLSFPASCERGMYFVRLRSLQASSEFSRGFYSAELPPEKRNPVNLALDICTFRRERYVRRNLNVIQERILDVPENDLSEHLQLFIVDNGETLPISELSTPQIHVVHNRNVGGSGGFARGMLEILNCKTFSATHVLLMDDDVVVEPDSLYRTYAILCSIKPAYRDAFVGAAMLRLDDPSVEAEAGAWWGAGYVLSRKANITLKSTEACLFNEIEESCDYTAWWYCCIPTTVARRDNLPLPFFIKIDDIEYGLRNMEHLILLNGICVWHEPFENKFSSCLEYYVVRNTYYTKALHDPSFGRWAAIRYLCETVFRQLLFYRYQTVKLIFRAVHDFLAGSGFFRRTDGEALHREILAAAYQEQPPEELEIPFDFGEYDRSLEENDGRLHRLFRRLTLNGLFLPANRRKVVPVWYCRPINFYRAKTVLQYNLISKKGFVTKKELGTSLSCLFQLLTAAVILCFRYDSAAERFRREAPELMAEPFWLEYLGFSGEGEEAERKGDPCQDC